MENKFEVDGPSPTPFTPVFNVDFPRVRRGLAATQPAANFSNIEYGGEGVGSEGRLVG